MSNPDPGKESWWRTAPGLLTAIAGVLTALTGLIVGLNQTGLLKSGADHDPPRSTASKPATIAATQPSGRNLLSPEQGGRLVAAPDQGWSAANDGDLDNAGFVTFQRGAIFGFQDDQPRAFDRFGVLISQAGANPASIEIAVSDALAGPFRAIAEVRPLDLRVIDTGGWQYFDLPGATARYVRITPSLTADGVARGMLWEMRLESVRPPPPRAEPVHASSPPPPAPARSNAKD
jgi:hypothetical protein